MLPCAYQTKVNNGAAWLCPHRLQQRKPQQPVLQNILSCIALQYNKAKSRGGGAGQTCRAAMRSDAPNNNLHAAPPAPPLSEAAKRILLAMLTKMVHQELSAGVASPATDQLLRARPETTSMEFMLWVAEQETQAQAGQQKELLASVCQRLVMFRELLDQERMDALFVSTSKALQGEQEHAEGAALLLGEARPSPSSHSSSDSSSYRVQFLDSSRRESSSTPSNTKDGTDGVGGNGTLTGEGDTLAGTRRQRKAEDVLACADESTPREDSSGSNLGAGPLMARGGSASDGWESSSSSGSRDVSDPRAGPLMARGGSATDDGESTRSGSRGASGPSAGIIPVPSPLPPSLASRPEQYALQLAQAVTGVPVVTEGYSPVYDLLLKAAPPAALTAEGVAKAHQEAAELGQDMRGRRQRSVASILGRTKLTPQQADQLMAGTAAARILDLLLSFPTEDERIALLPDCFTPPSEAEQGPQEPPGLDPLGLEGQEWAQGMPNQAEAVEATSSAGVEEETDELWCTPAQLLNELDARLRQVTDAGKVGMQDLSQQRRLGVPEGQLAGEGLVQALQGLRLHVHAYFMQAMQQK